MLMIALLLGCIISKNEIKRLQDCLVTVTCEDKYDTDQDYFYYGYVEKVTDETLKLRYQRYDGFKLIPLKRIRGIRRRNKGGF